MSNWKMEIPKNHWKQKPNPTSNWDEEKRKRNAEYDAMAMKYGLGGNFYVENDFLDAAIDSLVDEGADLEAEGIKTTIIVRMYNLKNAWRRRMNKEEAAYPPWYMNNGQTLQGAIDRKKKELKLKEEEPEFTKWLTTRPQQRKSGRVRRKPKRLINEPY